MSSDVVLWREGVAGLQNGTRGCGQRRCRGPVSWLSSLPDVLSPPPAPSRGGTISRCTVEVTMARSSLPVSAVGLDWPAFKGRDYPPARS